VTLADPNHAPGSAAGFATTRWSVVLAAPGSRQALADLCAAYWQPLYAYARRLGNGPEHAQDLTQEFFTRLLEKDSLRDVDPSRGRFRSYLLASFRHFLVNEHDRATAQKRGGGRSLLSFDAATAERSLVPEPSHGLTAEKVFERHWALALLEQTLNRLRREFTESKRGELFERLKGFLTGEKPPVGYQPLAAELGMTVNALTVAVHRLRGRYREVLREEIGRTVDGPADIDDEIRDLFAALA
jgi:RNA polymerase sigma factor (sigma-70 family)